MTSEPVGRVSGRRRWPLAVLATALVMAAGISTPGADVAGIEPDPQSTGLAASVLTRPSAVRGTDGRFHIAYELVLTDATPFAVDVERVEVRDAKTHRVLLSLCRTCTALQDESGRRRAGGSAAGSPPPSSRRCSPLPVRRSSGSTSLCDGRRTCPPSWSISL